LIVMPAKLGAARPDLEPDLYITKLGSLDPNSPINAALVLSDCRHWFSNIACCNQ
jgi:hypothetical protein